MFDLLAKTPQQCTNIEIGAFIAFIRAGGEVAIQGLNERIRGAASLVFVRTEGMVVGVAALKIPQESYRRRVSTDSGAPLAATNFPYELGWVFVSPEYRGNGLSLLLSQAALRECKGFGVFATSRTDNVAMHKQLLKLGFVAVGHPYTSGRGKHSLQVFANSAPHLPSQ
jgi:GNAT superfamily N-acetyltransferase